MQTKTRATPMPPAERRAALIEVTLGLIMEHGAAVSTRQIAEAAGVAEGTIFRVFTDKESLVEAAVHLAFDVESIAHAIRKIDPVLPLEERLAVAVGLQQARTARVFRVLAALRQVPPERRQRPQHAARDAADRTLRLAVVEIIGSDADGLGRPADEVARLLGMLAFSGSFPMICGDDPLSAADVVSVVLDGVRRNGAPPC